MQKINKHILIAMYVGFIVSTVVSAFMVLPMDSAHSAITFVLGGFMGSFSAALFHIWIKSVDKS